MTENWKEEIFARMSRYIVDNGNFCSGWTGATRSQNRPAMWFRGKVCYATRVLWEVVYGPIPKGLVVMHSCDNPECLLLEHLSLGTPQQNTADAAMRGRMKGNPTIPPEKKPLVYKLRDEGLSIRQIARLTGVSRGSVHLYIRKRQQQLKGSDE